MKERSGKDWKHWVVHLTVLGAIGGGMLFLASRAQAVNSLPVCSGGGWICWRVCTGGEPPLLPNCETVCEWDPDSDVPAEIPDLGGPDQTDESALWGCLKSHGLD